MIEKNDILTEIKDLIVWDSVYYTEALDLMRLSAIANENNIKYIISKPEFVESLWAWLEKSSTKIMVCFDYDSDISFVLGDVITCFKNGADSVRFNVDAKNLDNFISGILPIKDDIFKNKEFGLCIKMDEYDIMALKESLLEKIGVLNPDFICFESLHNKKAIFAGRIYTLLNALNPNDFKEIHFNVGNDAPRVRNVWWLINKNNPDISNKVRFVLKP